MTLERFISIVEESDHKVGIYPELKSALAGNLVLSSRSQNTTVEQLLVNILDRCTEKRQGQKDKDKKTKTKRQR